MNFRVIGISLGRNAEVTYQEMLIRGRKPKVIRLRTAGRGLVTNVRSTVMESEGLARDNSGSAQSRNCVPKV